MKNYIDKRDVIVHKLIDLKSKKLFYSTYQRKRWNGYSKFAALHQSIYVANGGYTLNMASPM